MCGEGKRNIVTLGEAMWVNALYWGLWKTCCNDQIVILHIPHRNWTFCNLDLCPRMMEV